MHLYRTVLHTNGFVYLHNIPEILNIMHLLTLILVNCRFPVMLFPRIVGDNDNWLLIQFTIVQHLTCFKSPESKFHKWYEILTWATLCSLYHILAIARHKNLRRQCFPYMTSFVAFGYINTCNDVIQLPIQYVSHMCIE